MISTALDWAENTFGNCDLADKRLTKRLVQIGAQLASRIGKSLSLTCGGNDAALEGSYRFIRNDRINSTEILSGSYKNIARAAESQTVLLAIEDTTSFSYHHSVKEELGSIGGKKDKQTKGIMAHDILLFSPLEYRTLGLIEQTFFERSPNETTGKKRKERNYEEKETYKWETASRRMTERLGKSTMEKVISVCDREADVYDYLEYKKRMEQRFVVRAWQNRKMRTMEEEQLFDTLKEAEILGEYDIYIAQKGGRKARTARVSIQSRKIIIDIPKVKVHKETRDINNKIELTIIYVKELKETKESISWILLTTEAAETYEEARLVVSYYERRWYIEEFHKAWKTGAGAERQRMQSGKNIKRMLSILSLVAVRLLQLRESLTNKGVAAKISVNEVLREEEIEVLIHYEKKENNKRITKNQVTLEWAYGIIAKLGGWSNSKRTGIASWQTIWDGWFRLQERLEGYYFAKELSKNKIKS